MASRRGHRVFIITCILLYLLCFNGVKTQKKKRRSLSRRPLRSASSGGVNIPFVRATSVDVNFNYIQGAKRFFVSAREWINGKKIGNEASHMWLSEHERSTTLRNLNPGREYIILVQAFGKVKKVGVRGRQVIRTSQQCYVCNAKSSNDECQSETDTLECPHDKDACLNEVRYSKGVPKLTKRCAQWRPELGKQIQNGKDVTKACHGRENIKDVACKCMCRSNLCNKVEMPCLHECFKELPAPKYSYIRCSKGEKVGSICKWFCVPGFKIRGTKESECRRDRTWSVLNPPECVPDGNPPNTPPIQPCPILQPPENSYMECTDQNKPSSTCTFSCFSGYILTGSATRTCDGSKSKWTGVQPTCKEITCNVIEEIDGLTKECNAGETIGSVCDFSCPADRKFVGQSSLTCLPGGRWSSSIPKCTEPDCSVEPGLFANVVMECGPIPNRRTGKVCEFSCMAGYERVGPRNSFCYSGNSWTNTSPTCRRVRCRPSAYAPQRGFVRCSNRDYYGSTCVFSCEEGYMLRGSYKTTCGSRGRWSTSDFPTCQKIKCPVFRNFNGLYSCSNGQNFGSVCRFSCRRGLGFEEGTVTKVKCVAKDPKVLEVTRTNTLLGKWDGPVPTCIDIGCPSLGEAPDFATVKCTNRDYKIGTVCTYRCAEGYNLVGSSRITCVGGADGTATGAWSNLPPTCRRVTCEALSTVAFGTVECTDGVYAGSRCSVECDYGRNLVGKKTITCLSDGEWSHNLPTCRSVTCSGVPLLKNGFYNCGLKSRFVFEHECQAGCNNGFRLSAPGAAVCGVKGNWLTSEDTTCVDINECEELDEDGNPTNGGCEQHCINTIGSYRCACNDDYELKADGRTCKITICPDLGAVEKGRISCTNDNKIGSTCTLRCIPGFEVVGTARVNCLGVGRWTSEIGTCERISCPALKIPEYGIMECNLGFKFGSECKFNCTEGFIMRGKNTSGCGANRKWTSAPPFCDRITCDRSILTITNALVTCTDSNRFESMCTASCNQGYKLDGIIDEEETFKVNLQCLEDATWSSKKPQCIKKRCKPFYDELTTTRLNGTVTCTDSDLLGSTCELTCDKGYEVEGEFKIKCVDDAAWNKKLGYCRKIRCPTLSAPMNGKMACTDEAAYLSKCSFGCNVGYKLNGDQETECQFNRVWTKKTPVCERIECTRTFMKLLKGSVTCTDEAFFGSVCEYLCDPGYEFVDTKTEVRSTFGAGLDDGVSYDVIHLKCDSSALWGGEKPTCQRHECVPPSILFRQAEPNGNVQCSNGDRYESVCELSCEKGFEVHGGRSSTQCMDDRNWNPKLGRCTRKRCPMFAPLVNGAIQCSNANFFESRCLFGCYPGYRLVGSPVSTCKADRTFSHEAPICEKIDCPKTHTTLLNGNVTCSDGAKFESECVYVCNPGYEMVFDLSDTRTLETTILRCLSSEEWGGRIPICRRKKCSTNDGAIAKARLHGTVTCSKSFWFQSVCTVQCKPGFRLVGPASSVCTANADWSPPIGYCERRTCPALKQPRFGTMECTNGNKFESVCKFKCDYGYELIGFEESTCLQLEFFSSVAPNCREILCPLNFLKLDNGKATCTDSNKLDSQCLYECDAGYQLTATSVETLNCTDTYHWSELKPQCEKKVCPQGDATLVRAAQQGTLTCTDGNKFQSICSVVCYPGYKLTEGGAFTECGSDQKWGPELGYCIKIMCEEFLPLEYGAIECTDSLRYQSVCSFACEPGHELTHDRSSTCQANRKFSEIPPECVKITCPRYHLRIFNGQTDCTNENRFGSVCSYECNEGFERVTGSETAQCLADGTWNAAKTGCERIVCDGNDPNFVTARENGVVSCSGHYYYGSVCSLRCNDGFELTTVTTSRTKCNEFAQWDGDLGSCTRVQCPALSAPTNGSMTCSSGNIYGSECTFVCESGYEMQGEDQTTCQANRTWSNEAPVCEKIECSKDNLFLEHGTANCTESNKFLSVCWYKCNPGYESDEDVPFAMCTSSRAWSRNKPNCVKRVCNFNEEMISRGLENGEITCSDEYRFQSVCTLACNEGYELATGTGRIECTETGDWDRKIGQCEKITCNELTAPKNGKMECTDQNRYESVCTFVCEDGYEMEGSPSSECLPNGTFSRNPPTCVKTKCPSDHLRIPFGNVDCTDGNNFLSICSYECLDGFELIGDEIRTECQSNQTWTVDIPICEKKACPHDAPHLLKAEEHGTVTCTQGSQYESVCSVECDLGYEITGEKKTECSREGTWTNPIGYCEKVQCDEFDFAKSVSKFCTDGNFFNSSCTFYCEGGYAFSATDIVLEEEITMTCESTKTWTAPGSTPQCTKTKCPKDFLQLTNGNVTCTDGAFYRSQCFFQCAEGYELEQPNDDFDVTTIIATCQANSTWDLETKPKCRKIICSPDIQKDEVITQHGEIVCTQGSNFESKCTITCHKGYEISGTGATETICQSDRTWTPLLGTCQKISCPRLVVPVDSTLQCSDGFKFKSACHVVCNPGFAIYDPENDYDESVGLECKANGEWCGELPTCTRIRCPRENLILEGGSVHCTSDNLFESQCQYSCDPGYQMTQGQEDTTTCTPHQTWSNPPPTCQKRRCPANETSIKEANVNGEVICTDENKFDSECKLHCAQGFELSGEEFTTCQEDGEWSNGIGLCNKIECGPVEIPPNARMVCSDKERYESLCTFSCEPGYMLTAKSLKAGNGIVCQANGLWEGEIIQCEKITCPALGFTRIDDGEVQCNDSNHFMSRCVFKCDGGHEIEFQTDPEDRMSAVVNCTERGFWDVPSPPKCNPITCEVSTEEMQKNLQNGVLKCTSGAKFNSQCRATCLNGYELVGGDSTTLCGSDKQWGPALGTCQKISCRGLEAPKNGRMVCDDGFRYMSQCVFDCLPGYRLVLQRKEQGVTTCKADGDWIGRPGTCEKIRCDPSYLSLSNGKVVCSESSNYDSECEFICNEGFELNGAGSKLARCRENGIWDSEKPFCKVKTCKSMFATNGFLFCSGTDYNSVCTVTCEPGHNLVGSSQSSCIDSGTGETAWTPPLGKCEKIRCPKVPSIPNGSLVCSDENRFRSRCFVTCDRGYEVGGTTFSTTCNSRGRWTGSFQTCRRITCDPSYLTVDYGTVHAGDGNNFGSTLRYFCPSVGHVFFGVEEVTCLDNGKWSALKPRCRRISCLPLHLPNGEILCNGKTYNDYRSQCRFSCNENYEKIGFDSTECQLDGTWSNPTPYCRGHCDVNLDTLPSGRSECTNSYYHHSRCTFSCSDRSADGRPLFMHGNDFLTCKTNGKWDGMPPCCAHQCMPDAKMDLFFVFHSTSGIGYHNWWKITDFASQILNNFNVGPNNVLAGAVRYHRFVDSNREISIGKYQIKSSLQRQIRFMTFGGIGTNTGKALQHVAMKSVHQPGNRADVSDTVILVVDGKSEDDVKSAAQLLKMQNITVYVIAVKTRTSRIDLEEIATIASQPTEDHVAVVQGYGRLSSLDVSKNIAKRLCKNPCLHSKEYVRRAGRYINDRRTEKTLKESDLVV